jgi:hypothetical protein
MVKRFGARLDTRELDRIRRQSPTKAAAVVQQIAQDVEREVKTNWSPDSPSPEGGPPGVDTSTLTNSVAADQLAGNMLVWIVQIGASYGADLEFGTARMAARPFFVPAIERGAARLPSALLREVVT